MRRIAPSIASGFGFVVAAAAFAFAPPAHAAECAGMQREFSGELQKASSKTIVVDNKKGDKIKFEQHASTVVSGIKTTWDDLKKGDYVSVCSKMLEKPRYAYTVDSKEPPAEAEE